MGSSKQLQVESQKVASVKTGRTGGWMAREARRRGR